MLSFTMKPVTQQNAFGCGDACISFITQISYDEIVYLVGKGKVP